MTTRLLLALSLIAAVLVACGKKKAENTASHDVPHEHRRARSTTPIEPGVLRAKVLGLINRSIAECAEYQSTNKECVKRQFDANYHYEILEEGQGHGHPGTPGPIGKEPKR